MADRGESLKKVRMSCLSADRLALLGPGSGKVDEPRAVVFAAQQAALDHDVQQLAHARRAGGVGQLCADLFHRRPPAAMEDLHDLALTACQVGDGLVSACVGRKFSRHTNIFATKAVSPGPRN